MKFIRIAGLSVRGARTHATDRDIVRSINDIARELGKLTVAECFWRREMAEGIRVVGGTRPLHPLAEQAVATAERNRR